MMWNILVVSAGVCLAGCTFLFFPFFLVRGALLARIQAARWGERTRFYSSVTRIDGYLGAETEEGAPDVFIYEGVCVMEGQGRGVLGGAVQVDASMNHVKSRLRTLNIAACEALERSVARRHGRKHFNVTSNGVGAHWSWREAGEAGRRELIERDVVLLHYYCGFSASHRLVWDRNERRQGQGLKGATAELLSWLEFASISRLKRVYDGIDVFVCFLTHAGTCGIGFGCCSAGDASGVEKAIQEAVCMLKAWHIERIRSMAEKVEAGFLSDLTVDSFHECAQGLGYEAAEVQMAIVMMELLKGEPLSFQAAERDVSSVAELLMSEEGSPLVASPARIDLVRLGKILGGLKVCRAVSSDAFLVGWPKAPLDEIRRVAEERGVEQCLGPNVGRPNLIS